MKNAKCKINKAGFWFASLHFTFLIFHWPRHAGSWLLTTGSCVLILVTACEREARRFRDLPAADVARTAVMQGTLQAGASAPPVTIPYPYDGNAFAVSEGKRLYTWFNCVGCHAHGGGDIGPPLMDAKWIYGSEPENIYATIVEGRPNGMPAYRHKIPEQQVWQLVAYVRSMSGQLRKDVSPGRNDGMNVKKSEQSTEEQPPTDAGTMQNVK
jgi:cytochrome c oxidase cbb3-type subunit III